ncbi:MAG: PIN domain-containing protein [Victivallales bacterium]
MKKSITSSTNKDVFIDTGGFYSILVSNDSGHVLASASVADSKRTGISFITTDYVLDETATLLKARGLQHLLPDFFETIFSSKICRIEWTDSERFISAKDYFIKHGDKDYSFTDCVSFVTMRELNLQTALTRDQHFRQAGFIPILT